MGLDMMLYRTSIENEVPDYPTDKDEQKGYWDNTEGFYNKLEEIGYWRKFHSLHQWFVDNTQGGRDECQYSVVPQETLQEVLDLLQESFDTKEGKIEPMSGFFFGSTDIDDYYWSGVEDAIEQISKIIVETDYETEQIIYSASW